MPKSVKSADVVSALRSLADSLERSPEITIPHPTIYFSAGYGPAEAKDWFLSFAKIMPRPIKKSGGYRNDEVVLEFISDALDIRTSIEKSKTCTLVKPAQDAVYECDPILSKIEEMEVA